jgi:hypothetical protein
LLTDDVVSARATVYGVPAFRVSNEQTAKLLMIVGRNATVLLRHLLKSKTTEASRRDRS